MEPREVMYVEHFDRTSPFFLAGDIGGTNCNFGIFSLEVEGPRLVLSLHYKSAAIKDFTLFMKRVVDYLSAQFAITISEMCLGAAGIVYPHRVSAQPTNLSIDINTNQIAKVTAIADIFLINDFEAVALGLELINPASILSINKDGVHRKHANIAFVGAGTGFGKSMMVWHHSEKRYFPVSSEGGHADAVFFTDQEIAFAQFIQRTYASCPVSWEMILSGAGIQKIYRFLGELKMYPRTDSTKEIERSDFDPDKISFYAERDERCKDTFSLYRTFYARVCKNFVLESLSLNGIYIAGGIAAKNRELFFDPLFMQEFLQCGRQGKQLHTVPVFLITDYNVSLYGAVVARNLRSEGRF